MQPQEYYSPDVQLGLETLTICPKKNQTEKHCNSCMFASSFVSSSASSLIGDYIGMESCFDLDKTEAIRDAGGDGDFSGFCDKIGRRKREPRSSRSRRMKEREFPPPITSLSGTENLSSYMPLVLKRYYTCDGRLILREERVRRNEYFRAHRSNGRLTLHLVPLDDDDGYDDDENDNLDHNLPIEDIDEDHHHETDLEEVERKEEEPQINVFDGNINNAANDDDDCADKSNFVAVMEDNGSDSGSVSGAIIDDSMVKCSSMAENPSIENAIAATSSGKLLNFRSVRTSPTCFLGMPVPAIRPVHT